MDISSIVIKLIRKGGISEPNYNVEIKGDGTVVYEGIRNVSTKGPFTKKISEEELLELLSELKDSGFFSIQDNFEVKKDSNISVAEISLKFVDDNGILKKKKISYHSYDPKVPVGLKRFEDKIDEVIDSNRFIKKKEEKKRSVNKKSLINKNKKPIIALVCISIVLILISAIFIPSFFDSNKENSSGIGDNSGDSVTEEFSNPEILFYTTSSQDSRVDNKRPSSTTIFEQGDMVYVYFEFENVTHEGEYNFSNKLKVVYDDITYYEYSKSYNNLSTDNMFYSFYNISTNASWPSDWTYTVNITLFDHITNKSNSLLTYFTLYKNDSVHPTVSINASTTFGYLPLSVSFEAMTKDFENVNLVYIWDFNDGTENGHGKTISHTFYDNDSYNVILTVDDLLNDVSVSENIEINVLNKKIDEGEITVNIDEPTDYLFYYPQWITFNGTITGVTTNHPCIWKVYNSSDELIETIEDNGPSPSFKSYFEDGLYQIKLIVDEKYDDKYIFIQ